MSYYYFPYGSLVNAITSFTLGLFVFFKNPNSRTSRSFFYFTLSIGLWALSYFFWLLVDNLALFYIRLAMTGVIIMPFTFIYFTSCLLNQGKRFINFANYLLVLFFLSFSFSPIYIKTIGQQLFFDVWPVPGRLFHIVLIHFFIMIIYGHILLYKAIKSSHGTRRNQLRYVFLGTLIGFMGGCSNYFLWYSIPVPPYLNILVSAYILCVTYAIMKHQLMDIKIAIRKTLIYSSLISIMTITYFIIVYLLHRAFSAMVGYHSVASAVTIIVLFSIIFIPLKNKIQHTIDRRFFKGSIDQIERERQLLGAELQRSERLKAVSTLAAGMAHEIKNPLTAIKTFAEHIDAKHQDPNFRTKFNAIVPKEIDKITNIINQLLDYSKTQKIIFLNY